MKVSRLLCSLLPVQADHAATASNVLELAKQYVFLEILPSVWKLGFLRSGHICTLYVGNYAQQKLVYFQCILLHQYLHLAT